jgi:hypothetical protein
LAWRWPGETIEASAYTRHGHVAVLLRAQQRALYEDGHLALVLPERQSSEELVHLALVQVREPRRIFVARGLGGLVPEILKHPVAEVAVAEPEATLAEMEIKAADLATRQALRDPRVHMLTGDVRNLLRQTTSAWGAGELRSPRTIAGGFGDPSRVPMSTFGVFAAHHRQIHADLHAERLAINGHADLAVEEPAERAGRELLLISYQLLAIDDQLDGLGFFNEVRLGYRAG